MGDQHPARWTASVLYRADSGPAVVVHFMEELDELHDLVERGPHWDTIERIEIRRTVASSLTLEAAAVL